MDYGWVGTEQIAHQRIGFFVDSDNRILYWRTRHAPGYVLDFETADQLLVFLQNSKRLDRIVTVLMGLGLLGCTILSYRIHSYVEAFFAPGQQFVISLLISFTAVMMGFFALFDRWLDRILFPDVYGMLRKCPYINLPRPRPEYLKRSEYQEAGLIPFEIDLAVIVVGLLFVVFGLWHVSNGLIGDVVLYSALGGVMIWWGARMMKRERSSLFIKDIRLYSFPAGQSWSIS